MPQYNVRIHRLSTAPSVPQDVAVDHIVLLDKLNVYPDSLDGSLLVVNPAAIAALVITPTAPAASLAPTPAVVASKVSADAK